jgi:hypothetical protein
MTKSDVHHSDRRDEVQRQISEFLTWIQGVDLIESTPVTLAEFNAEDSIRARGIFIRLDEKS